MAEQFMIKGVDVMAQESKTALEMLLRERQVIEYYYNKDEDVRNGAFERFVKLVQLMIIKADPDDDEEITYVFQSVACLLNFFDSSRGGTEEREGALGILDFMAEHGLSFTEARYCGSERTTLRDYLLKKVYEKEPLIQKMFQMGIELDEALVDGKTLVHILIDRDRYGASNATEPEEQELAHLMDFLAWNPWKPWTSTESLRFTPLQKKIILRYWKR